ncbi:unnamed protein product [Ectocarpus sp. 4 AP-2014]
MSAASLGPCRSSSRGHTCRASRPWSWWAGFRAACTSRRPSGSAWLESTLTGASRFRFLSLRTWRLLKARPTSFRLPPPQSPSAPGPSSSRPCPGSPR